MEELHDRTTISPASQPFSNQLVELEVQRRAIAVLRVLDKKHHQERDDRRARIDDQLPGVRILKNRPGRRPGNDEDACEGEGGRAAALPGCPLCGRVEGSSD